jgi:hypothetical protein
VLSPSTRRDSCGVFSYPALSNSSFLHACRVIILISLFPGKTTTTMMAKRTCPTLLRFLAEALFPRVEVVIGGYPVRATPPPLENLMQESDGGNSFIIERRRLSYLCRILRSWQRSVLVAVEVFPSFADVPRCRNPLLSPWFDVAISVLPILSRSPTMVTFTWTTTIMDCYSSRMSMDFQFRILDTIVILLAG